MKKIILASILATGIWAADAPKTEQPKPTVEELQRQVEFYKNQLTPWYEQKIRQLQAKLDYFGGYVSTDNAINQLDKSKPTYVVPPAPTPAPEVKK